MLITVLFTIVSIWKHPKCPSIGEWIKMWDTYKYTLSYCSSLHFTLKIMPFYILKVGVNPV